jgi:hypothetical protein
MAIHGPDCLMVGRPDKSKKADPAVFADGSDKYL